eukprot:jgi/Astpho2/1714/Aster-04139
MHNARELKSCLQALDRMELMPDLHELAAFMDKYGLPRALITRNTSESVEFFHRLLPAGLAPFSPALSREFLPYKPSPDALIHICKSWGIAPQHAVMDDILAGRRAGCVTVLLDGEHHYTSPEDLEEELRPHFLIRSLSGLRKAGRFDLVSTHWAIDDEQTFHQATASLHHVAGDSHPERLLISESDRAQVGQGSLIGSWSKTQGATQMELPAKVGIELGWDAPHNCICLDVVFHNEQEQTYVEDNSGVHLVLSPQPEPSQAALLKLGPSLSPADIPEDQGPWATSSVCRFKARSDGQPWQVIAVFSHAAILRGRSQTARTEVLRPTLSANGAPEWTRVHEFVVQANEQAQQPQSVDSAFLRSGDDVCSHTLALAPADTLLFDAAFECHGPSMTWPLSASDFQQLSLSALKYSADWFLEVQEGRLACADVPDLEAVRAACGSAWAPVFGNSTHHLHLDLDAATSEPTQCSTQCSKQIFNLLACTVDEAQEQDSQLHAVAQQVELYASHHCSK